jgi:hypothetical protein
MVVAAVLSSFSLASCRVDAEYDLPNDVVWETRHFVYHTRRDDGSVCEGIVAKLEQHFSAIQEVLGIGWPNGRIIHYYKFITPADLAANSPCSAGSAACTAQNHVYSYGPFEQHELVHAYLWPLAVPPPVITEGAAVALVCNRTLPDVPSMSLVDAMRVPSALSDQRVYDTGGRLVRFLLATFGPASFVRFYSQLGRESSFDTLDQVMQAVYGAGADEIWAAALGTPVSCPPVFECSRGSILLDGTSTEISPTCGLRDDSRTFDLLANGEISISGPPSLSVASCDSISFSTIPVTSKGTARQQLGLVQLPQGRYRVDIRTREPATVEMVARASPSAGADCSALQSLILPGGLYPDLRISIPPEESDWAVKLQFEEMRQFRVSWPAGTYLSVCSDCSRSSCQTLSTPANSWDVSWQGDRVLRVTGPHGGETVALDIVGR